MKQTVTTDDSLVIVSTTCITRPRVVDWQDVYDSTKVEPDDDYHETPWDSCDGYDHKTRGVSSRDERAQNGYTYCSRSLRHGGSCFVDVPFRKSDYRFYHDQGASKGVAWELALRNQRKTTEQIVNWLNNGWEWWVVSGSYFDASDSLGGIDNFFYAGDLRFEIALNICAQLERDGHEIVNRPAQPKRTRYSRVDCFNWV